MDKFLYPAHPVRDIITGPSECGKAVFELILILIIINDFGKNIIFSPSLYQNLYEKIIEGFSIFISINVNQNILNEQGIEFLIDEINNQNDFLKKKQK